MTVYSTQLGVFAGDVTATPVNVFVCPDDGNTYVVRNICANLEYILNPVVEPGLIVSYSQQVQYVKTAVTDVIVVLLSSGWRQQSPGVFEWDGRIVLQPGDAISISASVIGSPPARQASVVCSGYRLTP